MSTFDGLKGKVAIITGASLPVDGGYGCLGPEGRISVMEVMGNAAAQAQRNSPARKSMIS